MPFVVFFFLAICIFINIFERIGIRNSQLYNDFGPPWDCHWWVLWKDKWIDHVINDSYEEKYSHLRFGNDTLYLHLKAKEEALKPTPV